MAAQTIPQVLFANVDDVQVNNGVVEVTLLAKSRDRKELTDRVNKMSDDCVKDRAKLADDINDDEESRRVVIEQTETITEVVRQTITTRRISFPSDS